MTRLTQIKRNKVRKVRSYTSCPDCTNWSVGVQANGRIVRHSFSFGSVERLPAGSRLIATPICKGSGKLA